MSRITKKRDVQDQLVAYLTGIGWTLIEDDELLAWPRLETRSPS